MNWLKAWVLDKLASFPPAEEHVSRDSLRYWLRRERQDVLDHSQNPRKPRPLIQSVIK